MSSVNEGEETCAFYRQIVMASADAIVAADGDQRLAFVNTAAEQLFGYRREDLLGQPLEILLPPRFREGHAAKVRGFQGDGNAARYMGDRKSHIVGMRADGTELTLGASILKVENEGLTYTVAIVRDISERMRLQDELVRIANVDPLTGALNRRAFLASLAKEQGRAARYKSGLSVLLFDLDRFKSVNDTYGHDIGDEVICRFSKRVQAFMRDIDVFGRWGGEEFIAALPHSDLRGARAVAERIREAVAGDRFEPDGFEPFSVTVSIGVASVANGQAAPETLIKWADRALYEAKAGGRDQIVAWNGMGGIRGLRDKAG